MRNICCPFDASITCFPSNQRKFGTFNRFTLARYNFMFSPFQCRLIRVNLAPDDLSGSPRKDETNLIARPSISANAIGFNFPVAFVPFPVFGTVRTNSDARSVFIREYEPFFTSFCSQQLNLPISSPRGKEKLRKRMGD